MREKRSKKKLIVNIVIFAIICASMLIIFLILPLVRMKSKTDYTMEEHIARISDKVNNRYIADRTPYTDFTVYPLFDQNDKFSYYCLVEFNPEGFIYVQIVDVDYRAALFNKHSMYLAEGMGKSVLRTSCRRYKIINGMAEYELDENRRIKEYKNSHFALADIKNERRYILRLNDIEDNLFFPAVKRGEKFLNLVSMEETEYSENLNKDNCPFGVRDVIRIAQNSL